MRTFIAILALAALAGCTVKNTTVRQAETPPRVVTAPAPTVVYQNPSVVVAPTVAAGPTERSVIVSYAGDDGFRLAAQRAETYCDQQFGDSHAELISDNAAAGRAVFACD